MRRVLPHTVALWAATASVAQAAGLRTEASCHQPQAPVRLTGMGFAPASPFGATLDGAPLGAGVTDLAGWFAATFAAPALPSAGPHERAFRVAAWDQRLTVARTALRVARPALRVRFPAAHPRAARARFAVFGMGSGRPAVYAHWVDPGGVPRGSVRLGRAAGPCGRLLTRPRRVLPFPPRRGRWTVQADTSPAYDPAARPRAIQALVVRAPRRRPAGQAGDATARPRRPRS